MPIIDPTFRGFVRYRSILTALLFFAGGVVFLVFGIYFLANPTPDQSGNTSPLIPIIFLSVGAAMMVVSVLAGIFTVRALRRMKPSDGEESETGGIE